MAQISQGQRQKLESRQFTPIQFSGSLTQLSFTFSPYHTIHSVSGFSPNDVSQTVRGLWQPSIIFLFQIPSTYTQLQTGQERTGSTCSVAVSFYSTFIYKPTPSSQLLPLFPTCVHSAILQHTPPLHRALKLSLLHPNLSSPLRVDRIIYTTLLSTTPTSQNGCRRLLCMSTLTLTLLVSIASN